MDGAEGEREPDRRPAVGSLPLVTSCSFRECSKQGVYPSSTQAEKLSKM